MKLLLTNDDGINAGGLRAVIKTLAGEHELYVAAPDRERSGTGHSITVFEPIKVVEAGWPEVNGAWTMSGTPVDCVKLALSQLVDAKIDLVISGINHGPNLGTDVLYSGTVSAAAEGIIMGFPALAVSLNAYQPYGEDFSYSARFVYQMVKIIEQNGIEPQTLLNINIPFDKNRRCAGIKITKLGIRNYTNVFEARKDPRGNIYYWLGGALQEDRQETDSDVTAVQNNYISVTPIKLDLTDYKLAEKYRKLFKERDWGF
ncbi:MAG: 5'/3'-nucleotidase SurE [Syntrophomonadaceae bacterium]|jgi:5'-nucleotidase|nr:5'/3'-nucleotidase SurE [Syntrophomonadaceae bacterium]